jgi:hypothetical protein
MQQRQGDLCFLKVDTLPAGLKKDPTGVIVHSDATQHTHKLTGGTLYKQKDGIGQYMVIAKTGKVSHEDHRTNIFTKGIYEIRRQREYQSKDMTRLVVD